MNHEKRHRKVPAWFGVRVHGLVKPFYLLRFCFFLAERSTMRSIFLE